MGLLRKSTAFEEIGGDELRQKIAAARRELRALEHADPAEVVRQGRAAANLKRIDTLVESIETGRAELASRSQEAAVNILPAIRAFREDERAKRERHKQLEAVLSALRFVVARRHPELEGQQLVADRLDESERAELIELVAKARQYVYDDGPQLDEKETVAYERLL
jgi:hypothetical protein